MPELELFKQLKNEPMALVVLGALFFYKIFDLFIKHVLPRITHTKKKTVVEILADDALERKERQAELDGKLDKMETSIDKLFSIVTDLETVLNKASQGTLENMLFNEDQSMFKRLKAFQRLMAMHVNGRIREYGLNLVLQNKEAWRDVLEAHVDLKIVDQKYFDDVMEDIDKRIFRY